MGGLSNVPGGTPSRPAPVAFLQSYIWGDGRCLGETCRAASAGTARGNRPRAASNAPFPSGHSTRGREKQVNLHHVCVFRSAMLTPHRAALTDVKSRRDVYLLCPQTVCLVRSRQLAHQISHVSVDTWRAAAQLVGTGVKSSPSSGRLGVSGQVLTRPGGLVPAHLGTGVRGNHTGRGGAGLGPRHHKPLT